MMSSTNIEIIGLAIIGLCGILSLIIYITASYHLCCIKSIKNSISQRLINFNVLTMIFAVLGPCMDFTHIYLDIKHNLEWFDTGYYIKIIMLSGDVFTFSLALCFYITLYMRLDMVFKQTQYRISTLIDALFYTLVMICVSIIVLYCYFCVIHEDWNIAAYTLYGASLTDLIITVLLLSLFVTRIKSILKNLKNEMESNVDLSLTISTDNPTFTNNNTSLHTSLHTSLVTSNDNLIQKMESQSDKLQFILIRQTVLGIMTIIISQAISISAVIFFVIEKYYDITPQTGTILIAFEYGFRGFGGFAISLALWLSFSFNVRIYTQLCHNCHHCCSIVCLA